MASTRYDVAVIGSGPAGHKGAIAAAKLRKKVVIIDRPNMMGGVCIQTGTIPSKTMREAILYLTGAGQHSFYGKDYRVKDAISAPDLSLRVQAVVDREVEVIRNQLRRNGVVTVIGTARFTGAHTLEVETAVGPQNIEAEKFLIACGTRSAFTPSIPLDGEKIFSAEQILSIKEIPREMIVVGAGVIGLEYASMFAALGTKVTVIDQRPTLLDFVDREIIEALGYHMRKLNAIFRLGESVTSVEVAENGRVIAKLDSGKQVHGEALLYTVGRTANSDLLNLAAAGLTADSRGKITVNSDFQTSQPHIYAAGDVIGFPSLASSSTEQGRLASGHMFGEKCKAFPEVLPYGIYTIPEISTVGRNEQQLTADKVPYEVGIARYDELAKGAILGDDTGLLKLLFDPSSLKLLGIHIIGERAAEIIHIGQAVLALGGTIEYFRDTVFNYPTLAEAYKVAALAGLNRL
ncbi:MAG: Si-specific NAD(P)(+) transhydrogenase [Gemmatimonadota bacterium]|nr:Si-specific NAD(P)(+) transhydrogenase [Gemmatimonadota bacterium]